MLRFLKKRVAGVVINGLVNVDQVFDPESENPQSGKAVAEAIGNVPLPPQVDEHYDPESGNPQSGIAVAQALKKDKEWVLLDDVTFTETVASYSKNFSPNIYKELYVEGVVYAADKTNQKQEFALGAANTRTIARVNAAFGHPSYDKVLVRAHLSLSPGGTYIADMTASLFGYTISGAHDAVTGRFNESSFTNRTGYSALYMAVGGQFAENTTFKVWGR